MPARIFLTLKILLMKRKHIQFHHHHRIKYTKENGEDCAISIETGSASGLTDGASDGATKTAMKLQCLKVDGCFLWHGNPGLQ